LLRLFYLNPRKAARRLRNEFSCGLGWTEMVRRFGFPTLDAAIGKVEYPGLDLSRVRWDGGSNFPNNDREGVRVPAYETGLARC